MEITDLLQKISETNLSIGSTLMVDVLQVNHPHSFYVLPQIYKKYLPLVQAPGNTLEGCEVSVGNVYIFQSTMQNTKVRGQLLSFENNDQGVVCRLRAIDFGFEEDGVLLKNMWKTLCEAVVPPLALHCRLYPCEPIGSDTWDAETIHAMKYYIGDEDAMIIVKGIQEDLLLVELLNSCPLDIASTLALTDFCSVE